MTHAHWFEELADHMGPAYLRYSFTKGTGQEVGFLIDELDLQAGDRVLDVGCGPGRHAGALAAQGIEVVGVDISETFVELARTSAPAGATFERLDARRLAYDGEFDAAISLCQGAFGLVGGPGSALDEDGAVLAGMARAVRPGGRVAVSAFSAYFQIRYPNDAGRFDAEAGVHEERTEVLDPQGAARTVTLWTTCFTPRELRLMAVSCGLTVDQLWSVSPGQYERRRPDLDHPEFLLIGRRPMSVPSPLA